MLCWGLSTEAVWLELHLYLMASAFFNSGFVYATKIFGEAWHSQGAKSVVDWVNLTFLSQQMRRKSVCRAEIQAETPRDSHDIR